MKSNNSRQVLDTSKPTVTEGAVKVLANSIFRQLQSEGCQPKDIISVSSQLLGLLTCELQKDPNEPHQ